PGPTSLGPRGQGDRAARESEQLARTVANQRRARGGARPRTTSRYLEGRLGRGDRFGLRQSCSATSGCAAGRVRSILRPKASASDRVGSALFGADTVPFS